MRQISKLTDPDLIATLVPSAKPYDVTVTIDDFDEYDNWGPGEYFGVEVSDAVAARWDDGIAQCRAQGMAPRSRAGLTLRHRVMHGHDRIPARLEGWIARREAAARAKEDRIARRARRVATYEALFEGFTSVQADAYSAEFRQVEKLALLERLGELPGEGTDVDGQPARYLDRHAVRLPNGDIMEILGGGASWTRWTRDPELTADRTSRAAIQGYLYGGALAAALADLERDGALRVSCYSYLGGTHGLEQFENSGYRVNYSGMSAQTAPEKVARLREWLTECMELHPGQRLQLRAAHTLAVEGAIVEVR